jgi:hypothetical protein
LKAYWAKEKGGGEVPVLSGLPGNGECRYPGETAIGRLFKFISDIRPTVSGFDARVFWNLSGLFAAQPVPLQCLVEEFWRNEEIGLAQPSDGIGKFYQPLFSGTFQQANSADD